ncbi:MAG: hypothetical protein V3R81_11835 [Gammaproteobacteria bacterium]
MPESKLSPQNSVWSDNYMSGKTRAGRRAAKKMAIATREPNGQVVRASPALEAREARSVGIAARIRVKGIAEKNADKVECETTLGRLALECRLAPGNEVRNAKLWRAGEFYLLARIKAQRAKLCKSLPSGSDYERQPGHDSDEGTDPEYVRQCLTAITISDTMIRAIIVEHGYHCWAEIESVVMEDHNPVDLVVLRRALATVLEHPVALGVR